MRRLTAFSLFTAMAGTAFGQPPAQPAPAAVIVPPAPMVMPTEIPKMGDPDAVCLMASANMAAMAASAPPRTPEEQQKISGFAQEQLALYSGRLTARFAEGPAQEQSARAAKAWVSAAPSMDKRPLMQWCLKDAFTQTNSFQPYLTSAYKVADDLVARGRAVAKVETLDPDSLCIVLIGTALPATMERAKRDPGAQRGVSLLREAQSFYIGRSLAKTRKAPIDQTIADALLYLGAIIKAKDEATAYTKVKMCTDQYSSTRVKLFQAAAKAAAPEGPPTKPKG
jgi:hypothetical protein